MAHHQTYMQVSLIHIKHLDDARDSYNVRLAAGRDNLSAGLAFIRSSQYCGAKDGSQCKCPEGCPHAVCLSIVTGRMSTPLFEGENSATTSVQALVLKVPARGIISIFWPGRLGSEPNSTRNRTNRKYDVRTLRPSAGSSFARVGYLGKPLVSESVVIEDHFI
jgi:hypothetical protein